MKRRQFIILGSSVLASALLPNQVLARRYLTLEEAQNLMFPDQRLRPVEVRLNEAQRAQIEQLSGAAVEQADLSAWRHAQGGWFLLDQVIGKHEYISWALALDPRGAVQQIEVLDYRESYGGEVRNKRWREQFHGASASALPVFKQDIRNISGATLSCSHMTAGVRRLLATHELVLKYLA